MPRRVKTTLFILLPLCLAFGIWFATRQEHPKAEPGNTLEFRIWTPDSFHTPEYLNCLFSLDIDPATASDLQKEIQAIIIHNPEAGNIFTGFRPRTRDFDLEQGNHIRRNSIYLESINNKNQHILMELFLSGNNIRTPYRTSYPKLVINLGFFQFDIPETTRIDYLTLDKYFTESDRQKIRELLTDTP